MHTVVLASLSYCKQCADRPNYSRHHVKPSPLPPILKKRKEKKRKKKETKKKEKKKEKKRELELENFIFQGL